MTPEVFIAYAREDAGDAETIVRHLQGTGLKCWCDVHLIPGTPEWEAEIERAIKATLVSVVLISPHSVASRHVKAEFSLARDRDKEIIPLFLAEQVELPDGWGLRLTLHQYLCASPSLEAALPPLADAVWRVVDRHRHPAAYHDEAEVLKRANYHIEPKFAEDALGLFLGENAHSVAVIEDGAYVMASKPGAYPGYRLNIPRLTEFVLEARLTKLDGPDDEAHWFGFFFGEPFPKNFHEFLINGQGTVRITKHLNRQWHELGRHQGVRQLNRGNAPNTLKIIRQGGSFHVLVNGLHAHSITDGDVRMGALGLLMGPDLRVAFQDVHLSGFDLDKIFKSALWHLGTLDARRGRQLLQQVLEFDPQHRQAARLLQQPRLDYRDSILIVIGHKMLPQIQDSIPAARLREEINRRGKSHATRFAAVVTDTGLLAEEKYLKCPVIAIGGYNANKITADLRSSLPRDAGSTETMHIQHDLDKQDRRVLLWGSGPTGDLETGRAVEVFMTSGLLDSFLDLIWGKG
jgi:hypothetical protein